MEIRCLADEVAVDKATSLFVSGKLTAGLDAFGHEPTAEHHTGGAGVVGYLYLRFKHLKNRHFRDFSMRMLDDFGGT